MVTSSRVQTQSLFVGLIAKFKTVFAEHRQETKPVWDTEAGWGENLVAPESRLASCILGEVLFVALVHRRRTILLVRVR